MKEKCSKCEKKVYMYVDGTPYCIEHLVKEYYGKNEECLKEQLYLLSEKVFEKNKLDFDEKEFILEVKKQFPKIIKEYPILLKNI